MAALANGCIGLDPNLGYHVVKTAISLGMEILLRVPHLSVVLQGEDTVNFKVKYMHACLLDVVVAADVAAVVVAAATVDVDDALAANAHANADVDDACSDVVASAWCI